MIQIDFSSEKPIYLQIAEGLADAIITGAFAEETQIPSTTEISAQFKINPATVLKGMSLLVDQDVLYKKRGLGMFVRQGAVDRIRASRQAAFYEAYIVSMLQEAKKLGLSRADIVALIERGTTNEHD